MAAVLLTIYGSADIVKPEIWPGNEFQLRGERGTTHMKTKSLKILAILMALSMALMLTACGGDDNTADGGDENDQTVTALTEEEYQQAVTDLSDKLTSIQTDAANLHPTDVDATMKLLDDMKQPFIEFMAVTPPESYADAHAKMQSGCQAMVDYIDTMASLVDETDAAAIQEGNAKMTESLQTAVRDLAEGGAMLSETAE